MNDTPVRILQIQTPRQIRAELERVGADSLMEEKVARAQFHLLKLERVSLTLARLLYQELVMEGGQVVTAPRLNHVGEGKTDVLLCATRYQFNHLIVRLRWQPSQELQTLGDDIARVLEQFNGLPAALDLGSVRLDWTRTYTMGILNMTPDSFSGDALILPGDTEKERVSRAAERARQLVADGADVLDIGGESTRPGAVPVPLEAELERVLPVVQALKAEFAVPLSIDTSKSEVAQAALEAGAQMVNDVTGLQGDPRIKDVVAQHQAPVVITHNWLRGKRPAHVSDVIGTILDELRAQIEDALTAGVPESKIVIDPGLGFGKKTTENLEILDRLAEFRALGFPILIGPSRKGFISRATGAETTERDEGTAAAVVTGVLHGAHIARVHNVRAIVRAARLADAILATRAAWPVEPNQY